MTATLLDSALRISAIRIGNQMDQAGLPAGFIGDCVHAAMEHEGILDLMEMWRDADSDDEKNETIADLQESLEDIQQTRYVESTYVRFDDLEQIARNVMAFKDSLRLKVEAQGGIQALADKSGIPQPSLSRFFSSAAMPRRLTLLKIAKALHLSQVDIATEWVHDNS